MARIVILGAGVMGSALAFPATDAGNSVALVGTHLDEAIIASIADTGRHPRLGLALPAGVVALRHDGFAEALQPRTDLVVLGVSSAGVEWAIEKLIAALTRPLPVLMVTKGLASDGDSIQPLPTKVARALQSRLGFRVPVMAVGGPCIAGELAALRDTSVVLTGEEGAPVEETIRLLEAPYYHPRPSGDLIGVEVCAAFKNFFAIGVGTAAGRLEREGLGANGAQMYNTAAALFEEAVREMAVLAGALGGDAEAAHGLPGVADLYVTCQTGRNSRLGRWIGTGLTFAQAKAQHMPEDTVEGAELGIAIGPSLLAMMDDGRLDPARLPLTRAILDVLLQGKPFVAEWRAYGRG